MTVNDLLLGLLLLPLCTVPVNRISIPAVCCLDRLEIGRRQGEGRGEEQTSCRVSQHSSTVCIAISTELLQTEVSLRLSNSDQINFPVGRWFGSWFVVDQ